MEKTLSTNQSKEISRPKLRKKSKSREGKNFNICDRFSQLKMVLLNIVLSEIVNTSHITLWTYSCSVL